MRIVLGEMKKIWNPKTVLVVAALCLMFHAGAMASIVSVFKDSHTGSEDFALCLELAQKYGTRIGPEEFGEFYASRHDALLARADEVIGSDPQAISIGLSNYQDLLDIRKEAGLWSVTDNGIVERLYNAPENGYALYWMDALNDLKEGYELDEELKSYTLGRASMELAASRIHAIYETDEWYGIVPFLLSFFLNEYNLLLSWMVLFATLLMLLPLLAFDSMHGMRALHYSSRTGRRILALQFVAMAMSSVILTSLLVCASAWFFSTSGVGAFWDSYYSSFNSFAWLTLPLTFGQYVLVLAGMQCLWGLATTAFCFVISKHSKNPIPLLAGGIALLVLGLAVSEKWIFFFPLNNHFYETGNALLEPTLCGIVLALGVLAAALCVWRELHADI